MKYPILFSLCLTLFFFSCNHKKESTNTSILITNNVYLKKILKGEKQTFTVKCINKSENTVKLREINIPCICLKIKERYNNKILKHDSIAIHFDYLPENSGYIEKNIEFYFDMSIVPLITKISAHVRDSITT